jgi:hypothetical protein
MMKHGLFYYAMFRSVFPDQESCAEGPDNNVRQFDNGNVRRYPSSWPIMKFSIISLNVRHVLPRWFYAAGVDPRPLPACDIATLLPLRRVPMSSCRDDLPLPNELAAGDAFAAECVAAPPPSHPLSHFPQNCSYAESSRIQTSPQSPKPGSIPIPAWITASPRPMA